MAHTQGEWELVELNPPLDDWTGARYVIRQPKHAPGGIAAIIGGAGGIDDANLLKAAPKLLFALRYVLPLLEAKEREQGGLGAYVRSVRGAIAEAEGEPL